MQNETFLCISNRAWDSLWGESQKVMSRIARQNRVLYFEPGRTVNRPLLSELWRNSPNFFRLQTRKVDDNLIVISTPSELPVARRHLPKPVLRQTIPRVTTINNQIIARHIRWAMKAFNVKNPILWLYSPYQFELVGKFGEKISCYHNYDEFSDFINNVRIKNLLQEFDNQLSKRVDLVFCTSRPQMERRKRVNPHTYFVPNGVDFELFNKALDPNLALPDDIGRIPHPIIGFAGMLGFHIDVKLLLRIAESYPDCSLVLVGPDRLPNSEHLKKLKARKNVYFLGFKPLEKLPEYIQAFDAALIPYILEGHVLSGYPQKLHEYLAGGRSIVATAMPELQPFSHYVRIAQTQDEFVVLIRDALTDYDDQTIQRRVALARVNTWEHRVKDYYRILEEFAGNQVQKKAA